MKQTVNYSKLPADGKQIRAVLDIKEYLGAEKFNNIETQITQLEKPLTGDQFAFLCSVAGIEGYPVDAWYMSLYGDDNDRIE